MKGTWKEYKVIIYYIDSNYNEKTITRKAWGVWDKSKLAYVTEKMERKYNKDIYEIQGIAVQ